jgi:hypothetical protein
MSTQIVTAEVTTLPKTKSPALPFAPQEYNRQYLDDLNKVLRQYFVTLDNFIDTLGVSIGGTGEGVFLPYGAFQDLTAQTTTANTATVMKFNTTDFSSGVSVVTSGGLPTRLTVENSGLYNLQWSGQFQNTDNAQHDISVWLRVNGTDLAGSTGYISIPARKSAGAGNEGHVVAGWNYFLQLNAGQYVELWWSTTNAAVTLHFYPAGVSPTRPTTASLIATLSFVSAV